MNILLVRDTLTPLSTIGRIYVNNVYECYSLEDVDRRLENGGVKIHGETAIPLGSYAVTVTMSARFKMLLPILHNVPQFSGVRIHSGNLAKDTEGCILVGAAKSMNRVVDSRSAFNRLFQKINQAIRLGKPVTLKIERS